MSIKHKFSIVISLMLISGLALSGVPGLKGVQNAEAQTKNKDKDKDKGGDNRGSSGGSSSGGSSGSGSSDGAGFGGTGNRGMETGALINLQGLMNSVQNEIKAGEASNIRTNTFNAVQQNIQLPAVARSGVGNPATVAGHMPGTAAYNSYLANARQAAINSGTSHTSHTSHADSRRR